MSGAISDSGHVTLDSVLATALPSPVVGTAHYVRTYHGSLGTFTMQLQTIITPTDVPWLWTETGHWIIIEATGAYEGLQGQGEELGVRNFSANTLDVVFTGQVH
jgi:ABC-type transporter Mla maintaining outer membrane lipid asymmetry permease subunit MlaE